MGSLKYLSLNKLGLIVLVDLLFCLCVSLLVDVVCYKLSLYCFFDEFVLDYYCIVVKLRFYI